MSDNDDFARFYHLKDTMEEMLERGEQVWICKKNKPVIKVVGIAKPAIENKKAITMNNTERPFTTTGDAVEADACPVIKSSPKPEPVEPKENKEEE